MPGRTKLRRGQTQTSKEEGGSTSRTTAQIEKYYSGGKREFTYKKNDRGKVIKVELKGGGMSSGQAKLAAKAPPPNKLDEKDLAVLRAEKAKGRGTGLQDESKKPGKIYKAALGLAFMKKAKDKGAKGAEFLSPIAMAKRMFNKKAGGVMKYKRGSGLDLPVINSVKPTVNKTKRAQNLSRMKIQFTKQRSRAGINSGTLDKILSKTKNPYSDLKATTAKGPKQYSSMAEIRKAKGFKPGESASQFNKRKTALSVAKKAASVTTAGKIALGMTAAGVAAGQYLKSKMNKKNNKTLRDARLQKKPGIPSETTQKINKALSNIKTVKLKKDKKMGGGMMMQKPMGYKEGMGPKLGEPRTQQRRAGPAAGRPGTGKKGKAGLGALGAASRGKGKEDSSVTLAKFLKASVAGTNESIKGGGMRADRATEGSGYRNKRGFRRDVEEGKYKATKDAAYYKSIGLTGKRGDQAVKDFYKPYHMRSDAIKLKSGGMTKPMGYKSGTSVKVKCKLGRNKPTKIT